MNKVGDPTALQVLDVCRAARTYQKQKCKWPCERVPDLEAEDSKSGTPTGPTFVASGGTGNGNDSAATGHVTCAIGVWACQQPVREVAPIGLGVPRSMVSFSYEKGLYPRQHH